MKQGQGTSQSKQWINITELNLTNDSG